MGEKGFIFSPLFYDMDSLTKEFINCGKLSACLFWVPECDLCKKALNSVVEVESEATRFKFFLYELQGNEDPNIKKFKIRDIPALVVSDGKGNLLGLGIHKYTKESILEFLKGALIVHSKKSSSPNIFIKMFTFSQALFTLFKNFILRKPIFATMDEMIKRILSCSICPERTKKGNKEVCNACGCALSLKVWPADAKCKKGFWDERLLKDDPEERK